jgi:8-oxo-dGTP pyrophosphatase MutT (NUDIX family)
MHVGGSKASDIKLVLQREPRTAKTWFLAGPILLNDEHADLAARELLEEIGLTLTPDDLTILSNGPVRVSLLEGKHELVYVFLAYVPDFRYPTWKLTYALLLSFCKVLLLNRPFIVKILTSFQQ